MCTRFAVLNESGGFVSAMHSTVGRAKVVAGVENWKQELERTPDEYDGNFGG
jgi:hypothetical protein